MRSQRLCAYIRLGAYARLGGWDARIGGYGAAYTRLERAKRGLLAPARAARSPAPALPPLS
eukprot:2134001-Rhodomonas_salina.1